MNPTIQDQIELEVQMLAEGSASVLKGITEAERRGDMSTTPGFDQALTVGISTFTRKVEQFLKEHNNKGSGRRHAAWSWIADVDAEKLAFLTLRFAINGAMLKGKSVTIVKKDLGQAVMDEVNFDLFYAQHRGAYKWVERQIEERNISKLHHRRLFFYTVAKHKGVEFKQWPEGARIHIGTVLLELLHETGLIELAKSNVGGKTLREIKVHPTVVRGLMRSKQNALDFSPLLHPMIAAPKPWVSLTEGGYQSIEAPLVKKIDRAERMEQQLLLADADLSQVYSAVNAMDQTPFKINVPVLNAVRWAFERNLTIGKLPPSENLPLPPLLEGMVERTGVPAIDKANKERFLAANPSNAQRLVDWTKETRAVHENNAKYEGARLAVASTVAIADKYAAFERIWFPSQLDFRGRVYPMPILFNGQSADYARSLLVFADGKHIETPEAMQWLQVHGANMFGYDKVSMDERMQWVYEHIQEIRACARDYQTCDFWQQADKPFSFLAWCIDYVGVDEGKPSYIRIAMDGSCNGLQHFSAMLRDPIGAAAVNLAPNSKPNDIYGEVAKVVLKKLDAVGPEEQWMANIWKQFGIDRKMTKRSVMVMPYGGQLKSTIEYVEDEFRDRLKKRNIPSPFGDQTTAAVNMLAKLVYTATREVVAGGAVVMNWLQQVAKVAADNKVHLSWHLPHGFVARQCYVKKKVIHVETTLFGSRKFTDLHEPTEKIDSIRSVNSISPNFVHSLDACALMMTVNKGHEQGITHWHMVHDDYGTHAADTPLLAKLLREAFVELYQQNDVLLQFQQDVIRQLPADAIEKLPALPQVGTFDIEQVLESEFFFA